MSTSKSATIEPLSDETLKGKKKHLPTATVLSPTVQDQVATGTVKILSSPHVSEGPGRIANAPVPSVFRDDRGEIHRLRISSGAGGGVSGGGSKSRSGEGTVEDGPLHHHNPVKSIRVNLLHSKADIMRSGYLHPLPKRDVVLSGKVELWTLTPDSTAKRTYTVGDTFHIEAYVPHILYSLEDSVVAEWWEEEHSGDLKCWYYHPYRRIVDVQNGLIAPSLGRFQRLVPQDEYVISAADAAVAGFDRALGWWTLGFAFGCAVTGAVASIVLVMDRGSRLKVMG
jgi:hypothetical protein